MKKAMAFATGLLFCGISVVAVAQSVVPAGVDFPITANSEETFRLGDAKEIVFVIGKSNDPSPFGAAANQLSGCELHVTAKLNIATSRLAATSSTIICNRGVQDSTLSKKRIEGQLVGADNKTGIQVSLETKSDIPTWALKIGAPGSFLLTDTFNQ